MNGPKLMSNSGNNYEVIIAGGGPAGTSAAIHLASCGIKALLVEQKKFPRAKLCGEFISPECWFHFRKLGVEAEMLSSDPASITETVFYSSTGRRIKVPSDWFAGENAALGLSRAEMDYRLLERAKSLGVVVLEEAAVSDLLTDGKRVSGIRLKHNGQIQEFHAPVTIDATGRTQALVRKLNKQRRKRRTVDRAKLVAFKVHLEHTRVAKGACEIYSYPGGYGGLSSIEHGLSNLCFIAAAKDVRRCGSDAEAVVRNIVYRNQRAAHTLAGARLRSDWLSVSLETFGRQSLAPTPGLLTIGDAAAFIDPFTGSGMLMAFESGELASAAIVKHLGCLKQGKSFESLAHEYQMEHQRKFSQRLRISGLLRRAAFLPYAAEAAILLCSVSDRLRRKLARSTRSTEATMIVSGSNTP